MLGEKVNPDEMITSAPEPEITETVSIE